MNGLSVEKPLAWSVKHFAERTGVDAKTVYDAINRGEIKAVSIGRRKLIPVIEIERLLGPLAGASHGA